MLLIGSRGNLRSIEDFYVNVNGVKITPSEKLKIVGCTLDSNLTWEYHINDMAKKAYFRIRSLYNIKSYFSQNSLITIGMAIVSSIVSYMACVWGATPDKYLHVAEKVIRALARLVSGIKKYDPVASYIRNDLQWLFPKELCIFKTLCIMHKIININSTPYFNGFFIRSSDIHNHNTRGSMYNYVTAKPNNDFIKNSFHYRAVCNWNNLSEELKQEKCYAKFKTKLKGELLI
jgi:hypothetical protein